MRLSSKNGKLWISTAIDKLHKYLDRAPVLVSDTTSTQCCVDGVVIIHEMSKTVMFFPFDYDLDPKIWVHNIKEKLLPFYPCIIENVVKERATTSEEMADFVLKGGDPENVPIMTQEITMQKLWRIDKVQLHKDFFILQLIGTRKIDEEEWTPCESAVQNRFKFSGGCSVIYLSKYRNGDFANQVEAGQYFFDNAIFIDELEIKN